jgi:hypothetical protein
MHGMKPQVVTAIMVVRSLVVMVVRCGGARWVLRAAQAVLLEPLGRGGALLLRRCRAWSR